MASVIVATTLDRSFWLLRFRMQIVEGTETALLGVKFVFPFFPLLIFFFFWGRGLAVDRHSNRIFVALWQVIRKYLNKRKLPSYHILQGCDFLTWRLFFGTLCKINMQIRFAVNKIGVQSYIRVAFFFFFIWLSVRIIPEVNPRGNRLIHMPLWGTIMRDFNFIAKRFCVRINLQEMSTLETRVFFKVQAIYNSF